MKILPAACCGILFSLSGFLFQNAAAQQLKLGDNPSSVKKEAILELNSPNQGLLLPRVLKAQTLPGGKLFNADDGMLVFVNDASEKSLYIKRNGGWEKVGDITNKAVTYNKIQDVSSQSLLGRYSTGDGITQEVKIGAGLLLNNANGNLTADHNSNLWNAGKLQNNNIASTAPANGQVLKWNGTNNAWEPAVDMDGGATYGTLPDNDISKADAPDITNRMKIWASPVTGKVQNGPLGTDAHSWNVLSFRGGGFTTQLYFDKEGLALKEWGGNAVPLTNNAFNPWFKVVTTHGDNIFTDGGIIFAGKTATSSSEVRQRADKLFWNNTDSRLGIGTNAPNSTVHVNGSIAKTVTILTNITSVTLNESHSTIVMRKTGNNGNNYTVYLPDAASCTGRIYHIARDFLSGWGNVYVDETVNDQFTRRTLSGTSSTCTVQSIGTRWITLGSN